jgi:hypothetical protein
MFSSKFSYLDFDIYSRRLSFFYKNKEKLGSTFGFILTALYIIISFILFLVYFINTIRRKEVTAADSTIYPIEIPSIEINNNLFYLAFGLEHPTKLNRYIDERIYYPKVFFIEKIKVNGEFEISSTTFLKVERCNINKFGDEYKEVFGNKDLNNSYCLQDLNVTLEGGYKYDKMSLIKINIYPCKNSSENNNHCKPKDIIDEYLTSTYFSILAKDIGLNPFNYSFPVVTIFQDLYTTIDKSLLKEFIIYFGINEIDTDIGLFSNIIKKEIYLKYMKDFHSFFFLNEEDYKSGKEILTAEIRLGDNIHFQKRTYTKMSQVLSTTGGYMQVIYTLFGLIALLTKKISIEKKLLNSLFNFNIKQKKIILCIEYKKKIDYISSLDKDRKCSFIPYEAKKTLMDLKKKRSSINLINRNTNVLDKMVIKRTDSGPIVYKSKINESLNQSNKIEEGLFHKFMKLAKKKELNKNLVDQSINRSKINMIYKESNSNLNDIQQLNGSISPNKKRVKKSRSNFDSIKIKKNIKISRQKDWSNISFNFLDYYCLRKMTKKNVEIELFHFGYNFFRSQMDIINFINIILLAQIIMMRQTDKKQNIMSQTIELSIK